MGLGVWCDGGGVMLLGNPMSMGTYPKGNPMKMVQNIFKILDGYKLGKILKS